MQYKLSLVKIAVLACFVGMSARAHTLPVAPDTQTVKTRWIDLFELNRKSIAVAENERQAAESESQSTTENRNQTPKSEAAEKNNKINNSNDPQTKTLKPFKPSEEIAAEQAVDFPVDI